MGNTKFLSIVSSECRFGYESACIQVIFGLKWASIHLIRAHYR
jgi:hypothetical protein